MAKKKKEDVSEEVMEAEVSDVQEAPKEEPKKVKTFEEAINMAADLAARFPSHAGKSASQQGTDIGAAIRDLLKK